MARQANAKMWMADFQKEPKQRREKGPLVREIPMGDYFRTKMHVSDVLLNPNPEVIQCPATKKNLVQMDHFVSQKTLENGPCSWNKKKKVYIPMQQELQSRLVTKMSVKSGDGVEYEFST